MKLNQTKSNGSVRLCSTCSIIILMKKTVFDFIQLLKYDIIEQLPAIEFDRHFVGFCLINIKAQVYLPYYFIRLTALGSY